MKKEFESVPGSAYRTSLIIFLLSCAIVSNSLAQAFTGTIVKKKEEKLTGISVQATGPCVTAASDAPGNFRINPARKSQLAISSVDDQSTLKPALKAYSFSGNNTCQSA